MAWWHVELVSVPEERVDQFARVLAVNDTHGGEHEWSLALPLGRPLTPKDLPTLNSGLAVLEGLEPILAWARLHPYRDERGAGSGSVDLHRGTLAALREELRRFQVRVKLGDPRWKGDLPEFVVRRALLDLEVALLGLVSPDGASPVPHRSLELSGGDAAQALRAWLSLLAGDAAGTPAPQRLGSWWCVRPHQLAAALRDATVPDPGEPRELARQVLEHLAAASRHGHAALSRVGFTSSE